MHFSNFLNFRPLIPRWNFGLFFLELAYPKGCFGKIKKNSIFSECLSILDFLRKWLLNPKFQCKQLVKGTTKSILKFEGNFPLFSQQGMKENVISKFIETLNKTDSF